MINQAQEHEIRDRVQKVFREVFDDPALVVTERTVPPDIPAWDSLTHISLIIALEEAFGIQFMSREVTSMSCVGDLFEVLKKKL